MWQVLVAAAVAGSGLFAKHLFNADGNGDSATDAAPEQSRQRERCRKRVRRGKSSNLESLIPCIPAESNDLSSDKQGSATGEDAIFRFSSEGSSDQTGVRSGGKKTRKSKEIARGFKKRVGVQKLERRFSVSLKRRRTGKSASAKCGSSSSKDSSFFGGISVGIMYMMSAGKAEISKLNTTVDETAKVVQELKAELYKRKSSSNTHASSSVDEVHATKFRDKNIEPVHIESKRVSNSLKDSVLPVSECASSVLTEEPAPEMLEMDQLEAELESELQKLPGCITEDHGLEGMRSSGFGEMARPLIVTNSMGCHHLNWIRNCLICSLSSKEAKLWSWSLNCTRLTPNSMTRKPSFRH
ncbi:uncharacterized protein LOC131168623 isoform X2 [Malania oleifera]|uniref:uncharacterized protein LOC131168623 isoform X2 n=1 Tax=Malania oleifera TaxID=397392 RepID=UPI0025AE4131|nr:uncharacterized protein LOC131168623 isoform X2 [Malania oleifera]